MFLRKNHWISVGFVGFVDIDYSDQTHTRPTNNILRKTNAFLKMHLIWNREFEHFWQLAQESDCLACATRESLN